MGIIDWPVQGLPAFARRMQDDCKVFIRSKFVVVRRKSKEFFLGMILGQGRSRFGVGWHGD